MKEWGELIHPDDLPNLLAARQLILRKQEQYFTNAGQYCDITAFSISVWQRKLVSTASAYVP